MHTQLSYTTYCIHLTSIPLKLNRCKQSREEQGVYVCFTALFFWISDDLFPLLWKAGRDEKIHFPSQLCGFSAFSSHLLLSELKGHNGIENRLLCTLFCTLQYHTVQAARYSFDRTERDRNRKATLTEPLVYIFTSTSFKRVWMWDNRFSLFITSPQTFNPLINNRVK